MRSFASKFGFDIKESTKRKTESVKPTAIKKKPNEILNIQKLDRYLIQQYDSKKKKNQDTNKNAETNSIEVEV